MLELYCIFILWRTAIQPTRSVCQIIQAYICLLNLSLRSTNSSLNMTIHLRLSLTSYPNGWDWKQQLKVYIIVNHHGWKTYGYNQMQNRPGFSGFCWCHITSQFMWKVTTQPCQTKSDTAFGSLSNQAATELSCNHIFDISGVLIRYRWFLFSFLFGPQILCWI